MRRLDSKDGSPLARWSFAEEDQEQKDRPTKPQMKCGRRFEVRVGYEICAADELK